MTDKNHFSVTASAFGVVVLITPTIKTMKTRVQTLVVTSAIGGVYIKLCRNLELGIWKAETI